ncbi:MAG: DUF4397 domain-containing protein [Flavobacteriales bacterium]|nr:DUF4397 domain-containing protein [Flavobacteriales bacterium]
MHYNRTLGSTLGLLLAATQAYAGGGNARLQVIHNSADAAAAVVDVYVNGGLLIDDFAFRTAWGYNDVPAGVDLQVGLAPGSSTSAADTIPGLGATFNLADGVAYVLVANGIVSGSGYTPATPFELYPAAGQESSAPGTTAVNVFHGCTDAPAVDVFESAVLNANAVSNLAYGQFTGAVALPTADYVLEVRAAGSPNTIVAYSAPLQTLGLGGLGLTVVASGFLDPAQNSDGPGFGLWVALPAGGDLVELPVFTPPTARLQVIHNSADAAAAVVDVYVNGGLLIDDFGFRTAWGYEDVPAGVDLQVGIAPGSSTSAADTIPGLGATFNLADGVAYVLVANGIVSGSGYTPATPFELYPFGPARESATSGANNTDILVFHGCTDAPVVDVAEIALVNATLVDDLAYGSFDGYLEVPTNDYVLQVQLADGTPVIAYQAPLATLGLNGAAITVLASGFLNPAVNSDGAPFGLWVALASGGDLVELPIASSVAENIGDVSRVNVWPNPAVDRLTIALDVLKSSRTDIRLLDVSGRIVSSVSNAVLQQGENRFELPVEALAAGSYQLLVTNGNAARAIPVQVVR